MNRFGIAAALTIGLIGPVPLPAAGPDKPSRPLPREVVAAWEKAGAIFQEGDVPAFCFSEWKAGVLAKLPRPDRGFGLDLHETQVTDAGLKELAALKELRTLNLASTKVTDAGLKELAALKELRSLNLSETKVRDAGLKELGKLKQLEQLDLYSAEVTYAGLKELAGLERLHTLNPGRYEVTGAKLKELVGATKRSLTAAQCERLNAQLVNPDKAPFTRSRGTQLPEGIDGRTLLKKQEKIPDAYDTLSDNIEISLPILGKYVDDEHFSYIFQDGIDGTFHAASVGTACCDILKAHVEVYERYVTKPLDNEGRIHYLSFIRECGGFEKWWQGRKDKTLAELQLEGIEWALRHEKPEYFKSAEEWAAAKKSLREMAEAIRTTKSPIVVVHHLEPFFDCPVPE